MACGSGMWEWYMRSPLSRFAPKSRMGEPLHRSMSLPLKESGRGQEDGLHTVQLLPVIITGRCGYGVMRGVVIITGRCGNEGCGLHCMHACMQMMRDVGSC